MNTGSRGLAVTRDAARTQIAFPRDLRIVAGDDGWPRYVLGPGPEDGRFALGDDGTIRIAAGESPPGALRSSATADSYLITIYGDV